MPGIFCLIFVECKLIFGPSKAKILPRWGFKYKICYLLNFSQKSKFRIILGNKRRFLPWPFAWKVKPWSWGLLFNHDTSTSTFWEVAWEQMRTNMSTKSATEVAFTQLSHNFHTTFTQLSHNFHTTFTQLSHNFHTTFTQLSRNFHTTFTQHSHNFHTTYTQLSHNFHTSFTQLSHNFHMPVW